MNLPTLISLLRAPLSLAFLIESPHLRTLFIAIAALTDFLDGYLARRLNKITPLGTKIDPLMDKLFVGVALAMLWTEGQMNWWMVILFLLRDISLIAFGLWLYFKRAYSEWQVRSFFSGKVATTLQFIILVMLVQRMDVPSWLWAIMGLFGLASFFELLWLATRSKQAA